jgi:hypothetical protein
LPFYEEVFTGQRLVREVGDMVINVPSQGLTIKLPNVLFIDRRLREAADLVVPGSSKGA